MQGDSLPWTQQWLCQPAHGPATSLLQRINGASALQRQQPAEQLAEALRGSSCFGLQAAGLPARRLASAVAASPCTSVAPRT